MLAGDSPITEKSAKEALAKANPAEQKVLESNIYDLKVSDYQTIDDFKKALDTKKENVIKGFNEQVSKGDASAKNSIEQATQAYDLLLKAATNYYANKKQ